MVEIELLSGRIASDPAPREAGRPSGDRRRALRLNPWPNFLKQHHAFDRLALHARALTLQLPDGNTPETIETPAIPSQMLDLFQNDQATLSP